MSKKTTPWRRKPKVKQLDEDIDTSMSFAVVGSPEKFNPKFHAYKVYRLLKGLGAEVYAVSSELSKLDKDQVFPNLLSLPKPVDVMVPCLPAPFSLSMVDETNKAGIKKVWFQNRTLSKEAFEFCQANEMQIIEGCALKYQEFGTVLKFMHPCYWHGKTILYKQKHL